jgi:hypothetical protein
MRSVLFLLAICTPGLPLRAADLSRNLLELRIGNSRIEGIPLAWNKRQVFLLARDGRLWDFAPSAASDYQKLPGAFTSYSPAVMRNQVQAELGDGFEVTGTGRYLVAYPRGQKSLWAERFEELYRSFVHYFAVRGFHVKDPEFPLVAIVLPDHAAFLRYAAAEGRHISGNVLGYYSPVSNRVALYDTNSRASDWHTNAETIIHEATHQTAFNTGIHSRFADQPRWAVEGLAMLFEAQGVWNSRVHTRAADRINRAQLESFRRYAKSSRKGDSLLQLISSDRRFDGDTQNAYAEAWALSFFLVETEPRKYTQYLQRLAAIPAFADRTAAQRIGDFTAIFGDNLPLLEARFTRFINELR